MKRKSFSAFYENVFKKTKLATGSELELSSAHVEISKAADNKLSSVQVHNLSEETAQQLRQEGFNVFPPCEKQYLSLLTNSKDSKVIEKLDQLIKEFRILYEANGGILESWESEQQKKWTINWIQCPTDQSNPSKILLADSQEIQDRQQELRDNLLT